MIFKTKKPSLNEEKHRRVQVRRVFIIIPSKIWDDKQYNYWLWFQHAYEVIDVYWYSRKNRFQGAFVTLEEAEERRQKYIKDEGLRSNNREDYDC
jgi:hypothetical protein